MASSDKSVAATLVLCEVRLKQIPKSEATVSQAAELATYIVEKGKPLLTEVGVRGQR